MIPELITLKAEGLPDLLVSQVDRFLDSGDTSIPRNIHSLTSDWQFPFIGKALVSDIPWNENARKLLRFFIHLSAGAAPADNACHEFLFGVLRYLHHSDYSGDPDLVLQIAKEIESNHCSLPTYVAWHLGQYLHSNNWKIYESADANTPFVSPVANLLFKHLGKEVERTPLILTKHTGLFPVLALHRSELTSAWCLNSPKIDDFFSVTSSWCAILDTSHDYDELCLSACDSMKSSDPGIAFKIMRHFVERRGEGHLGKLIEIAALPEAALGHEALELLFEHCGEEVLPIMTRAFALPDAGMHTSDHDGPVYMRLYDLMLAEWNLGGCELFPNLIENFNGYQFPKLLTEILPPLALGQFPALREGFLRRVAKAETRERADLWNLVGSIYPAAFASDFEELLTGKSKPLREIASRALSKAEQQNFIPQAVKMLAAKNSNVRHGAALFFESLADPTTHSVLLDALEKEQANEVRDALHRALQTCGGPSDISEHPESGDFFELEAMIVKQSGKLKLPANPWLKLDALPVMLTDDGQLISPQVVVFLISKQSRQKEIAAAQDILPLLAHINREKSAPFAAALVDGFLNSDQAASDRWALTLGGLLGDNRIITLLLPRINDWCENSRHKLAEYASQAISLLPGNEPLMVLDTLSNRYRSKFKNVGKACAEAFNAAATARGITTDELGDLVVPDFGFDAEGIRRFEWPGGRVSAELAPDFKLNWFDPETEKSWKSLPANAPDDIKTEVKTLTKLLREAVKGQTTRLEMTLVRQRRWPVARWRELYENHPLLRSFASSLVWGVYDASANLLRTFRRYPNGLLADASGALEELAEAGTLIGMVHPLELEASLLDAWRAHLARFKVKQPFPQIDRPVELMDPLHGNRRSISITQGKKLSAGTFRSRAEKRGWARGSVVDAGGISSYYKLYPGAGVEVVLPTNNFWVGCDPMEEIELEPAYFATAGTIERGSYIYNEPAPDDPRVLRFDHVPPVVFSETLADLKAITATKE